MSTPIDDDTPVYVISVAAQLSGLHPQTLRAYERMGLVTPVRAGSRNRRYSMRDMRTLHEIQRLSRDEGVNLAGVRHILDLRRETQALRAEVRRLRELADQLGNELESARGVAARLARELRRRGRARGGAPVPASARPEPPSH
ncbi:heat shock protein transcriptional repressor HspR [Actinomadura keratinilytica]|jgi:MerR family transcriptional regulator/heat shock protein HspR|uniref:HTH merR-type domain-containing protein n=1 Tax=Actinomadura keratinilytica TaxID=547461 RepID=A0ABP7Z706_9ACTN